VALAPEADPDWAAIEHFLEAHGAARIPHPGGTLLAHVSRVRLRLAAWHAAPEIQAAGLCHAVYGTDGFETSLLSTDQRGILADLIGVQAEELVYLYGSCDRKTTYPRFNGQLDVVFRDRFTDTAHTPQTAHRQAFAEITAANELDVVAHNPEAAVRHGPGLRRLLDRMAPLLSPAAVRAYTSELGPRATESAFEIARIDHLVLTVAGETGSFQRSQ
jgi:hypothetical protein